MIERRGSGSDVDDAEPSEPSHSPDGVDLTLIRWMLSLTPEQRLEALEGHVNALLKLRRGEPDL